MSGKFIGIRYHAGRLNCHWGIFTVESTAVITYHSVGCELGDCQFQIQQVFGLSAFLLVGIVTLTNPPLHYDLVEVLTDFTSILYPFTPLRMLLIPQYELNIAPK